MLRGRIGEIPRRPHAIRWVSTGVLSNILLGLLLSLAAPVGSARAQDDAETERARAMFFEGVELMNEERYREAAGRFRQVRELRQSAAVSFNLAMALNQLGQIAEAAELLDEVVNDPDAQRQMQRQARATLRRIEPQLGEISLEVQGSLDDVEITMDGQVIAPARLGGTIRAEAGERTIIAVRDGATSSVTVQVEAGASVEATLRVPPPTPEEAAHAAIDDEMPLDREGDESSGGSVLEHWWFWALVGVVVIGATTLAIAVQAGDDPSPVQGNLDPPILRLTP